MPKRMCIHMLMATRALTNIDTNELLCGMTARYGNGTEVFNEANYVALPPCLWGHQPGLQVVNESLYLEIP